MTSTPPTAPAARRCRARRIAMVLVLGCLLALGGSQCADGMGVDMLPEHATGSAVLVDGDGASNHMDGPGSEGGLLAICLALLFVVAAGAGLRPVRTRVVAVLRGFRRAGVLHGVAVRVPSLAELCVLRA